LINKTIFKLLHKIKDPGVLNSIKIFFNFIELRLFDIRYKTDTYKREDIESLNISSQNKKFGAKYDPSPIYPVKKILKLLKPDENDVFIDIGSGKGLILLLASNFCFKKIIGIEFSSELNSIAQNNILLYRKKEKIILVELDASLYTFTDETYFFLFNPFSKEIMEKVMENIIISYQQNPRKMTFVYSNPVLEELIISFNFFDTYKKERIMGRQFCLLQKMDRAVKN
jgi:uncharacterized protein YjgD (DUF1641 family)